MSKKRIFRTDDVEITCPLRREALAAAGIAESLYRCLSKLRQILVSCRRCPLTNEGCSLREELDLALQLALERVMDEWNRLAP